MSDLEDEYNSDHSVSQSHSKLLQAVTQLDKSQRVQKPERTEPTLEVSEYHLVKSGISDKDVVSVNNLLKSLRSKTEHTNITKRLTTHKKARVLSKPLEKPLAERLKRLAGFEKTTDEVKKWTGVISQNRRAPKLVFPLNKPSFKAETTDQFVKRFTLKSDLEKELAALEPEAEIKKESEEDKFKMTLKELKERRQEVARLRAIQSYKAAEASRQKKIKSKKFHRIQKKEKIKQQLKEFEELQKTDPKAALEKLQLLDKTRAEERMTLRHKSTGQWAKNKQVRAKYDKETRQVLAEQLSIGRELTQKVKVADSDSEIEENENNTQSSDSKNFEDKDNPWINTVKTEAEIDEFVKSYRKYWEQKNKEELLSSSKMNTNINSEIIPKDNDVNIKKDDNTESKQKKIDQKIQGKASMQVKQKKVNQKSEEQVVSVNNSYIEHVNAKHQKAVKRKEVSTKEETTNNTKEEKIKNMNKKKMKLSKKAGATSSWEVQSLTDTQTVDVSVIDKVDEMFDIMEDKLQSQFDSKLKSIKEKFQANKDEKVQKKKKKKNRKNKVNEEKDEIFPQELRPKKQHQKPDFNNFIQETTEKVASSDEPNVKELKNVANNVESSMSEVTKTNTEIDPNKYMNVKPKHLKNQIPDVVGEDDVLDDSENDEEKHNIISEAFADDDIVEQFTQEKEEEIKNSRPNDIDLTLPGWGSWSGGNIESSFRKRKRFIFKVPKDAPRKDENKGNVIVFENDDAKIKQHQVNELPFPFTTVKDFEASIRAPISREFLPENVHRKLIDRPVRTVKGQVIEPMDDDILIKTKNVESIKKRSKSTRPTGKIDPAKRKPTKRIKSKKKST